MSRHTFKAFELDPNVCDECGKLQDGHAKMEYAPYKEAIWNWLLRNGGVWSFYGGYADHEGRTTREHLAGCRIDWKKTTEPRMESKREFNGTFTEEDLYVDAVYGELFCRCGEIHRQEWACREKTLGQIIWEVVKVGERP